MERLDAIVFTAGIGENSAEIRKRCCRNLDNLGIEIDPMRNTQTGGGIREISTDGREVKILVVPTNEELKIALETQKVIEEAERKP